MLDFLLDLSLSWLIISGVKKLTKADKLWRALLYTSWILGLAALLDSIGIYITVPLAIFLSLVGITRPYKPNKEGLLVIALYSLLYLDPVPSRDNLTVYIPTAYNIVVGAPITEVHNAVAIGLAASLMRLNIALNLPIERVLFPRSLISFLALYDYLRKFGKIRPLALLAIPYRSYHIFYHPDYIDRLYALTTIYFFEGLLKEHSDSRIAFSVYAISKQSRPVLLIPIVILYYPRLYRLPLLSIFFLDYYRLLRSLPAIYLALYKPARRKITIDLLHIIPLFVYLARETYFFGRPFGGSLLSLAVKLSHSRISEAYLRLASCIKPEGAVFLLILAGYRMVGSIANTQAYSLGFVAKRNDLLRALSVYFLTRNVIAISYPRQSIGFWIFLVASLSYNWRLRLASLSRFIAFLTGDIFATSFLAITLLTRLFVFFVYLLSRIKLPKRYALPFFLALAIGNLAITAYYAPYSYYNSLYERSKRLKERIDGIALTPISPGYVNTRLLPVSVVEVFRAYNYKLVKPIFESNSLSELEKYIIENSIEAFFRSEDYSYLASYIFNKTLFGKLLLSDAFVYYDRFLNTLVFDSLKPVYVYYIDYNGSRIYGCGIKSNSNDSSIAILTSLKIYYAVIEGKVVGVKNDGYIRIIPIERPAKIELYTNIGVISIDPVRLLRSQVISSA